MIFAQYVWNWFRSVSQKQYEIGPKAERRGAERGVILGGDRFPKGSGHVSGGGLRVVTLDYEGLALNL